MLGENRIAPYEALLLLLLLLLSICMLNWCNICQRMSASVTLRRSKRSRTKTAVAEQPNSDLSTTHSRSKKAKFNQKAPSAKAQRKAPSKKKKRKGEQAKLEHLFRSEGLMSDVAPHQAIQALQGEVSYDKLTFGPKSCESIERSSSSDSDLLKMTEQPNPHTNASVRALVLASYPPAATMMGQRGQRQVTEMMHAWTTGRGLFTMDRATNNLVAPAARFIFTAMEKLPPADPKRKATLETLAEACIDCQQVQAREVMRFFSDFTNQTVTFEHQILYFLSKKKETALNTLITTLHPDCDLSWTQVQPSQQRPHLMSAYMNLLTEDFGIPGVVTARADRFMPEATTRMLIKDRRDLASTLMQMIDVKEFVEELLSDINNQVLGMDRLISPKCVFDWVSKHKDVLDPHAVFYDEARALEFKDQEPQKPMDQNQYEPFLSRLRLQQILLVMGVLTFTS